MEKEGSIVLSLLILVTRVYERDTAPNAVIIKISFGDDMTFGHDVFGINGYGIGNQIFRAAGTADDFTGDKVKVFQHCMADEMFSEGHEISWKCQILHGVKINICSKFARNFNERQTCKNI